jgi:hypothetical protein
MGKKAKVQVVTGFVAIPNHPRKTEEYVELGNRLKSAMGVRPIQAFYYDMQDLWLTRFLQKLPPMEPPLKWATYDNPQKNTLEYHAVQHQKIEWLATAANMDQEADTFVWVDYGIMHLPGMNGDYLTSFLDRIVKNDFAIPGCWPKCEIDDYNSPCWRFCGTVLIVPRRDIDNLTRAFKAVTRTFIRATKQVSFEVNMLALVEQTNIPNLRWYEADHNPRLFTGYEPKW